MKPLPTALAAFEFPPGHSDLSLRGDAVGDRAHLQGKQFTDAQPQVLARQKQQSIPLGIQRAEQEVGLFVEIERAPAIGWYLKMSGSDQGVPNARLLFGDDAREVRLHFRAGLEMSADFGEPDHEVLLVGRNNNPHLAKGENFGLWPPWARLNMKVSS